jgi:hypothetical protein
LFSIVLLDVKTNLSNVCDDEIQSATSSSSSVDSVGVDDDASKPSIQQRIDAINNNFRSITLRHAPKTGTFCRAFVCAFVLETIVICVCVCVCVYRLAVC